MDKIPKNRVQDDTNAKHVSKPTVTTVTEAVQTNRIWTIGDEYDDLPCDVPLVSSSIFLLEVKEPVVTHKYSTYVVSCDRFSCNDSRCNIGLLASANNVMCLS